MQVNIRTPKVPSFVYAQVSGAKRASKIMLAQLSNDDIEDLGAQYVAALYAERNAQQAAEQSE